MLPVDLTLIGRYAPDCTVAGVGLSRMGELVGLRSSFSMGGRNVTALVFETGCGSGCRHCGYRGASAA